MHHQFQIGCEIKVVLGIPIASGGRLAGAPEHFHHAVVVVVVLGADSREDGVDVLELGVGEIASVVDVLDEPGGRGGFDAYDGGFGVEVGDEHGC